MAVTFCRVEERRAGTAAAQAVKWGRADVISQSADESGDINGFFLKHDIGTKGGSFCTSVKKPEKGGYRFDKGGYRPINAL